MRLGRVALLAVAGLLGSLAIPVGSAAQGPPPMPPPGFGFGPTVQASFAISYQGHRYDVASGQYPGETAACVLPCQLSATSTSTDRADPSGQPAREEWALYMGGCPQPAGCPLGSGRSVSHAFERRPAYGTVRFALTVTGHDGSTDRVTFSLRVVTPRELPQPIYFDGPREVAAPGLLTLRTVRPTLSADWSGCGFRGTTEPVARSGPEPDGFYRYTVRLRQAPLCPLTLSYYGGESSAEGTASEDSWSVVDSGSAAIRVTANALAPFNGLGSVVAQGTGQRKRTDPTPYYLATAQTSGYATHRHTCAATVRLEWRIAEVRRGRLVKRWKVLRGLPPGRCVFSAGASAIRQPSFQVIGTGQPSYQLTTLRQELKVQLATMQRLRRIAPIRLVYQLTIRSGRQVVYRVARTTPLRLGEPYRDPSLPPG